MCVNRGRDEVIFPLKSPLAFCVDISAAPAVFSFCCFFYCEDLRSNRLSVILSSPLEGMEGGKGVDKVVSAAVRAANRMQMTAMTVKKSICIITQRGRKKRSKEKRKPFLFRLNPCALGSKLLSVTR